MKPPRALIAVVPIVAVLALVAAHLFAFGLVSSRLALPAAVIAAVVVLGLAAHLGALGAAGDWLRRRFHPDAD